MELNKIPPDVLEAVRSRNLFSDQQIESMPGIQLFDEYCHWHGIIGFGYGLWDTVEELQEAEK